jgi:hypothetical protein
MNVNFLIRLKKILIWSNICYFRAKIMYAILLEYLGKIACNFKQEVTVI